MRGSVFVLGHLTVLQVFLFNFVTLGKEILFKEDQVSVSKTLKFLLFLSQHTVLETSGLGKSL